jgi:ATP-dependent RNA helicase DeaD
VEELGYTTPTPIQTAIIPIMLTGRDVIGQAQTGTGKTAAFSLPVLHNLEPKLHHVQCLVVTPTRELAMQVANAMQEYGKGRRVSVLPVYGGQPYDRQIRRIKQGVNIVVGTPGRLLDLIRRRSLDLSHVATVILDEADEMLSMGFIEDIEAILNETPDKRQTALFSATLPPAIHRLANRYMYEAESVAIRHKELTVDTVEQRCYVVNHEDRLAALTRLFEIEDISSAIVFARTRLSTGELANAMVARGFPAEALHGDMSQDARERVLNRFRKGQVKVLVATDVAARGLDIDDISHIFNYEIPLDPESYVHRIGRTGRAGKTGIAISLITPRERWQLRKIETYTKQAITVATLPTVEDIEQYREAQLVTQMQIWLRRNRCSRERIIVADLVEQGHSLEDVAAIALKLARAEEKQRPIAPVGEVKEYSPRKRERKNERGGKQTNRSRNNSDVLETGMVRLSLSRGRVHGLRVNEVVGTLANSADIPGRSIGRIRIQERHTLVDVAEQVVGKVLANNGNYQIRKETIEVARA